MECDLCTQKDNLIYMYDGEYVCPHHLPGYNNSSSISDVGWDVLWYKAFGYLFIEEEDVILINPKREGINTQFVREAKRCLLRNIKARNNGVTKKENKGICL
jgi:hypothetical protein